MCQRRPNGGETALLIFGFGGDPLHTHPKPHESFSSTVEKDSNSDHRMPSLERDPKSSNLKDCNQEILEANQSSLQI